MPLEKLSEAIRGKKDKVAGKSTLGEKPEVTDVMPALPHKVLYAGLPFYYDKECTKQVPDALVSVLQPLETDGFEVVDVVPSRYRYEAGQYVNWQLNKDLLWEDCYYQNPDTGMVERAWTIHVEFVGQVISEKTVEANRKKLEEMEALIQKNRSPETVM